MDLFNHLLGTEGCNVDGTVGSNPFTAFVDNVFDSQFSGGMEGGQTNSVMFASDATNTEAGLVSYPMVNRIHLHHISL